MKMIAVVLAVLACAPAAAAGPCLSDGAALTGRFEWASLTAPRGKPIPAPFLVLEKPICTQSGAQGTRVVLELQDSAGLERIAIGATLTVRGNYAAPQDGWNTADIVAANAVIVSRP